jgi:hypothetical protein
MAKVLKQLRLEGDLIEQVQAIAEEHYGGNFTATIESLVAQSIKVRDLPVSTRWNMYDSVKQSEYARTEKETGNPNVRQLIDALHI